MSELINELLSLARIDGTTGTLPIMEWVEIDALVVDIFQVALERAHALGDTETTVRLKTIAPACVRGNANQLRQVLLILVDNAFKYAPRSTITLALQCDERAAWITITDVGPGIAAHDLPHIFDRFYRANKARDREGSGLGLAIARAIVTAHGGTLTATSVPSHGTTFTMTLPLCPSDGEEHS